jgi:hypothetical protein
VQGSSGHGHGRAGIQWARTRACRDPASTTASSSRVPVSIQRVKKRVDSGIYLLYKPCRARAWTWAWAWARGRGRGRGVSVSVVVGVVVVVGVGVGAGVGVGVGVGVGA